MFVMDLPLFVAGFMDGLAAIQKMKPGLAINTEMEPT